MSPNDANPLPEISVPPTKGQALARGFALRCPRCGKAGVMKNWFKVNERCTHCDLKFEREPGYWTGALAINLVCPLGLLLLTLFGSLIATSPDVPVVPLVIVSLIIALFGPLVWYPFSRTLWLAIDHGFLANLDRDN